MKSMFSIVTLLVLSSSFAQAAQTITCKFADQSNTDQVLVTLANDQSGSLLYSTGPQDEIGTAAANGSLALKRAADVADTAGFNTQVEVMQMSFKMPKAQILKTGVKFNAVLHTNIEALSTSQDQDLNCAAI